MPSVSKALLPHSACSIQCVGGTPGSLWAIKFSRAFCAFSVMCTGLSPPAVIHTALPHHRWCHKRCELKRLSTQLNSEKAASFKPYSQKLRDLYTNFLANFMSSVILLNGHPSTITSNSYHLSGALKSFFKSMISSPRFSWLAFHVVLLSAIIAPCQRILPRWPHVK